MDKNIVVRKAGSNDRQAISFLFAQEIRQDGAFLFPPSSPYHPDKLAVALIKATLNEKDPDCGWLAFWEGRPAGITTTGFGFSGSVFVHEAFRQRGVAQALLSHREHYYRSILGWTEVQVQVRAGNTPSLNLYTTRLGYSFTAASQHLRSMPRLSPQTVLTLVKKL